MTDDRNDARSYVNAALSLRRSIERNRYDSAFAEKKEIRYIFDTNVFIFNANVADSGNLIADLDHLVGAGEGRTEISKAIARLTADFLFSGKLPGQRDRKGYMTLPHFEESLDKAAEIERRLESRAAASTPVGTLRAVEAVSAVLTSDLPLDEKLRSLGDSLPKAWIDALDARAHFRRALHECFVDPQTLVPLDRADWGAAAGRLDRDDLQPWFNSLPLPSRQRGTDVTRVDAEALATVVNLYRRDKESRGRDRTRLYVLVTSDSALAAAVRERRALLADEGIPNFVRSPRDYLPLLNLDSMAKAMDRVRPTARLRTEFHRVFETLSSAVDWIAAISKDQDAIRLLNRSDGPLRDLQDAWAAISGYVTVLNARHLISEEAVLADLRDFITGEAERAATQMVATSVRTVRDAHLSLALDAAMADLRRSDPLRKANGPRRIHLHLVSDPPGRLGTRGGNLDALLSAVLEHGALPEAVAAIVADPDTWETQLLAACLFMSANRWPAAVQAASRAVEMMEPGSLPGLSDARYLLALGLRFSMRNRHDFERAEQVLAQNARHYAAVGRAGNRSIWRQRLRDQMERGSLLVSAAVTQELSRTSTGERLLGYKGGLDLFGGKASDTLAEGAKLLRDALEDLRESEGLTSSYEDGDDMFRHGLRLLGGTNLLEAYLFEQIAPGLQGRPTWTAASAQEIAAAFEEELEGSERAGEALIPTHYIYLLRARALLAASSEERARALAELEPILTAAVERHDLPLVDALEFNFIRDRLFEERI